MTCTQAMLSLFLLAPCEDGGDSAALTAALAHSDRPAADAARDEGRQPKKILGFFGIKPDMTVLEVFSGGGYYTQILDAVVGENGQVISQNNDAYMGFIGPQYEARFENGGLPNTQRVLSELADLELVPASLDATLLILTYHDFKFGDDGWPDADEAALIENLCRAMKPGAVLGIVDHVAEPGGDVGQIAQSIHRIDPDVVREDLEGSCFTLKAESDVLANADDDHVSNAWSGPFKGNTDRFVFKYVRN